VDDSKGFEYLTTAYNYNFEGQQFASNASHVCRMLGYAYLEGTGCNQSFVRAKYYLEGAMKKGKVDGDVYYLLATTMIKLADKQFKGFDIAGYSSTPVIFHLMRQAAQLGCSYAKVMLLDMEKDHKSCCVYCHLEESKCSHKLKACSRCKAIWYCGENCQQEHWKLGHKIDCVEEPDGCRACVK
jgi:TPR repeat protein